MIFGGVGFTNVEIKIARNKMTIKDLDDLVYELECISVMGGKNYKIVNKLLNSEATTDNIEKAKQFIKENK
ncbi:MAG: hypothetical protein DRI37_08025 [Chloroflexi bacterium]|nr:MAG: hypothetical protein DRI37_08025 [Chloroflexota bacterium]